MAELITGLWIGLGILMVPVILFLIVGTLGLLCAAFGVLRDIVEGV